MGYYKYHKKNLSILDRIDHQQLTFKAGEFIITPDYNNDYIYEIIDGLVKVYTCNENEEQYIHVINGPGTIFPMAWYIGMDSVLPYMEALNDVLAVRYKKTDFKEALSKNIEISNEVLARIIYQSNTYIDRVVNLEFKYASQRLAYRILYIGEKFGKLKEKILVLPPLTNRDLGRSTNLSRETVNREMSRFKRLNLIKTEETVVTILDIEGLTKEISKKGVKYFNIPNNS